MAKNSKVEFSPYFFLEILFIVYSLWQVNTGIVLSASAHWSHITTLILGLFFNISLYNFIILYDDFEGIVELYVKSCFWAFLLLTILFFNTIINGRFNANGQVLIFGSQNSTGLGYISGMAFFFSCWLYLSEPNKKIRNYIYPLFFLIINLLTGTRKTFLLIGISLIFIPLLKSKKNVLKIIKLLFVFTVAFILIYITVMNVEFLYEVIGERIENVIISVLGGDFVDGSIYTRNRLTDEAINYFHLSPINGWGLNNFSSMLSTDGLYAHNNYLEILVSSGVVGFIIFFSKYVYLLVKLLTSFLKKGNKSNNAILLIFIIVLMILEYWQVTFIFRTMTIPYVLILAFLRTNRESEKIMEYEEIKGYI